MDPALERRFGGRRSLDIDSVDAASEECSTRHRTCLAIINVWFWPRFICCKCIWWIRSVFMANLSQQKNHRNRGDLIPQWMENIKGAINIRLSLNWDVNSFTGDNPSRRRNRYISVARFAGTLSRWCASLRSGEMNGAKCLIFSLRAVADWIHLRRTGMKTNERFYFRKMKVIDGAVQRRAIDTYQNKCSIPNPLLEQ